MLFLTLNYLIYLNLNHKVPSDHSFTNSRVKKTDLYKHAQSDQQTHNLSHDETGPSKLDNKGIEDLHK